VTIVTIIVKMHVLSGAVCYPTPSLVQERECRYSCETSTACALSNACTCNCVACTVWHVPEAFRLALV
jgi:hypothetical protein